MGDQIINTRDQQFVLYEQLGIEKLFKKKYADYTRETVDMMLNEAEKMAVDVILPTSEAGDREGCKFKDGNVTVPECFHEAYKKFVEGGWNCAMRDPDFGGQSMPLSVSNACFEFFNAANVPFIMYPMLTNGAAGLIEIFGTEEQKKKYMSKMYSGEWGGTMCLTEPGAGSDVGALKTSARRLPDGRFSITGTKIFISCGDHDLTPNIIHPVLARIEGDPAGTRGISIFLVPKYRVNDDGSPGEFNDVRTGNIEHKMGIRGSSTCTLNFGDDGNCIGELLGKERQGMMIMFHMMNEARLEVGMQGLSLASIAYQKSVAYAKDRIQGTAIWDMKNPDAKSVSILQHPDIRRMLLWMKSHVEGIRALNYYASFCMDSALVADTPEEKQKWQGLVELLIPVCKAYSSDKGFQVCSRAIEVFGGYGYCSEYPVEQYLRDCKIASIYEGTNGIQALDLVGRKLGQNRGANVKTLIGEINRSLAQARKYPELKPWLAYLEEALQSLSQLTLHFGQLGKSASFLIPVLNATPYLELLGDVVCGWLLFDAAALSAGKLEAAYRERGIEDSRANQRALVHENGDVAFYNGKIATAKFFASTVLSTVKARCDSIRFGDRTPLEIADESFGV
ncbi:MAG TPA: acyl-CoA dehydrogenase [Syntrophales bacterium]|nr:acyl-CoA dehydrogenase [Syntrophales bacterium]